MVAAVAGLATATEEVLVDLEGETSAVAALGAIGNALRQQPFQSAKIPPGIPQHLQHVARR